MKSENKKQSKTVQELIDELSSELEKDKPIENEISMVFVNICSLAEAITKMFYFVQESSDKELFRWSLHLLTFTPNNITFLKVAGIKYYMLWSLETCVLTIGKLQQNETRANINKTLNENK